MSRLTSVADINRFALTTWGKSSAGYVTSKCGAYQIAPLHMGGGTAFVLRYRGEEVRFMCETQREAKAEAERHAATRDEEDRALRAGFNASQRGKP